LGQLRIAGPVRAVKLVPRSLKVYANDFHMV
jgi:hypothetical protein